MQLTLRASNGAKILVWREDDLFCARLAEAPLQKPEMCVGLDLFEIIAELAELDLEAGSEAAEAIELAEDAQRRLAHAPGAPGAIEPSDGGVFEDVLGDEEDPPPHARSSAE